MILNLCKSSIWIGSECVHEMQGSLETALHTSFPWTQRQINSALSASQPDDSASSWRILRQQIRQNPRGFANISYTAHLNLFEKRKGRTLYTLKITVLFSFAEEIPKILSSQGSHGCKWGLWDQEGVQRGLKRWELLIDVQITLWKGNKPTPETLWGNGHLRYWLEIFWNFPNVLQIKASYLQMQQKGLLWKIRTI